MANQKITTQHQVERSGLSIDAEIPHHRGFVGECDATQFEFIQTFGRGEPLGGVSADGG